MGDESVGPFGEDPSTWSNADPVDGAGAPFEPSDDLSGDVYDVLSDESSVLDEFAGDLDPAEDSGELPDPDALRPDADWVDEVQVVEGVTEPESDTAAASIDLTVGSEDPHQGLAGLDAFVEDLGVDLVALDAASRSYDPHGIQGVRPVVVALEELGVGVTLEHGDVDRLATMLENGATIRLGTFGIVTELDDLRDEVVVRHPDGARTTLALGLLEDAWGDHTYEMLVAPSSTGARVLLAVDLAPVHPSGGISR